ncbi:DUF4221 family protein [Algoriphagus namhaensis]|uniref:DUF4221 family protein n=1 Tax=Algoriphagus namhaensis TaxID=915353 RepID=A0ABV8ASK4_9BACT
MRKTLVLSLILILAFFSCENSSQKEMPVLELSDLVSDTLYLEKSPLTKELGYDFSYFEGDKEAQVLKTFIAETLYEYSFPEGRLLRTQKYESEGPDGIGAFVQAFFIEEDVIWFISNLELIKADLFGKVLQRRELPEAEESRQSANYSTRMGANMYRDGATLLIPDVPFVLNETVIQYEDWILKYDTDFSTYSYLSFTWPKEYQGLLNDANFSRYRNSYSPDTKEMLISLPASDSLLVIGKGGNFKVFAGVSEPMNFLKGEVTQEGEWIVFNSNNNTSQYGGIFWAEQEEVYLRMVEVIRDTEQNRDDGLFPLTKMVVLDKSLVKIGEVIMPFATGGFNTPSGFYLWVGYPKSEDQVGYVRLDFSKFRD